MVEGFALLWCSILTWLVAVTFATGWIGLMWWRRRDWPTVRCCVQCRYNLEGNTSGECPECGTPIDRFAPDPGVPFAVIRDISAVAVIVAPYLSSVIWLWMGSPRFSPSDLFSDLLWDPFQHQTSVVALLVGSGLLCMQFVLIERLVNAGRLAYSVGRSVWWLVGAMGTPVVLFLAPCPLTQAAMLVLHWFGVQP